MTGVVGREGDGIARGMQNNVIPTYVGIHFDTNQGFVLSDLRYTQT